jgi:hypothetical protein
MNYTLACKKCGLSFWGEGTYCGECDPKSKINAFSLTNKNRGDILIFKLGDKLKVKITNNPSFCFQGEVIKINGQEILLRDNEGFLMRFDFSGNSRNKYEVEYI